MNVLTKRAENIASPHHHSSSLSGSVWVYRWGVVLFFVGGRLSDSSLDHAVFLITFEEPNRASRMSMNLGSSP
jgi:hypothetical protein